jgi:hypothetical protein
MKKNIKPKKSQKFIKQIDILDKAEEIVFNGDIEYERLVEIETIIDNIDFFIEIKNKMQEMGSDEGVKQNES